MLVRDTTSTYRPGVTNSTGVELLFFAVLSGFIAHELDAVHRREWRLLFVLRAMQDDPARRAFVLLHVPLVTALLWFVTHPDPSVFYAAVLSFDAFIIVHAALHARLASHRLYEFHAPYSRWLIFGTAALAAAHAILLVAAP